MNKVAIVNPRGNVEVASAMCKFINERRREILAQFAALKITAKNYKSPEVVEAVDKLADAIEDLRAKGKSLVKAVCAETEVMRVLTQIDSRLWSYSTKADPACAYARLSEALKRAREKIAEFKAADTPPTPSHTYIVRITCADKQLDKLIKAAIKDGATDVAFCEPRGEKSVKVVKRLFEDNV